jgi:hypothetical protein
MLPGFNMAGGSTALGETGLKASTARLCREPGRNVAFRVKVKFRGLESRHN